MTNQKNALVLYQEKDPINSIAEKKGALRSYNEGFGFFVDLLTFSCCGFAEWNSLSESSLHYALTYLFLLSNFVMRADRIRIDKRNSTEDGVASSMLGPPITLMQLGCFLLFDLVVTAGVSHAIGYSSLTAIPLVFFFFLAGLHVLQYTQGGSNA